MKILINACATTPEEFKLLGKEVAKLGLGLVDNPSLFTQVEELKYSDGIPIDTTKFLGERGYLSITLVKEEIK